MSDYDALASTDSSGALAFPSHCSQLGLPLGIASMPTSLAVFWGDALWDQSKSILPRLRIDSCHKVAPDRCGTSARRRLQPISAGACLGCINRFQRLNGDIVSRSTRQASIPVPFVSARWGSLASFGATAGPGPATTHHGNRFVSVVEFAQVLHAPSPRRRKRQPHPRPHYQSDATTTQPAPVYFSGPSTAGTHGRVYPPGR